MVRRGIAGGGGIRRERPKSVKVMMGYGWVEKEGISGTFDGWRLKRTSEIDHKQKARIFRTDSYQPCAEVTHFQALYLDVQYHVHADVAPRRPARQISSAQVPVPTKSCGHSPA